MIPQAFNLDFTVPPVTMPAIVLDAPPTLALTPPDAGWIRLTLTGQANGKAVNATVRFSKVFSPLADLWLWSRALAANLAPARTRIDEEGIASEWHAEPEAEDGLRISLYQTDSDSQPHALILWHEPRADFLARWGARFAALFHDDTLPWEEWEGHDDEAWPEPARSLPWDRLAQAMVDTSSNWPRGNLIAWFWLLHAHHFRPGRAIALPLQNPLASAREDLLFHDLRLRCAAAAWRTAIPARALPDTIVYWYTYGTTRNRLEDFAASLSDTAPVPSVVQNLLAHIQRVSRVALKWTRRVETAVFARLPINAGQIFMDEHKDRGIVLDTESTRRVLIWETGAVTTEDGFTHASEVVWRWPAANDATHFCPLELPDALARVFAHFPALLPWPACPCCGYPPLDDDPDDIQNCDICGWPVWEILHEPPPALDAPGDDRLPSLRECRDHFHSHGDIWPLKSTHEAIAYLRSPRSTQARQACLADWKRWLADPARSARTLPIPVWFRTHCMEHDEND